MVIPSTLDGNTEYNIAEGIANTIFPGFFDFNKNLEQVKVLFSNLDGEFLMTTWVGLARAQTGAPHTQNRDYAPLSSLNYANTVTKLVLLNSLFLLRLY